MIECVAEFTTNHFGHPELLRGMVDAARMHGADCIKMQKKQVATFYSAEKLAAPFDSPFGKTYRQYRRIFELRPGDWLQFDSQCCADGIPWFVTPQDVPSLRWLVQFNCGLPRIKIASSNARNGIFLDAFCAYVPTDYEVVVSVAGCTLSDVEALVGRFKAYKRLYLLHCVAEYPCPAARLRLGNIPELKRQFASDRVRIGYSGHEIGYQPTLAAVQLGAEMVERHFCLSRQSFVHHIDCSLEPPEFRAMVQAIRAEWLPKDLPQMAYGSQFGMSEAEGRFLIDQSYGRDFLGTRSTLKDGP